MILSANYPPWCPGLTHNYSPWAQETLLTHRLRAVFAYTTPNKQIISLVDASYQSDTDMHSQALSGEQPVIPPAQLGAIRLLRNLITGTTQALS